MRRIPPLRLEGYLGRDPGAPDGREDCPIPEIVDRLHATEVAVSHATVEFCNQRRLACF